MPISQARGRFNSNRFRVSTVTMLLLMPAIFLTACGGGSSSASGGSGGSGGGGGTNTTTSQQWGWVGGTIDNSSSGSVGTIYDTARSHAETWTDTKGNLWLYGGEDAQIYDTGVNVLSDMWKFTPTTKQWVQIAPTSLDAKAVYGTQGVASSSNTPGARVSAATWVDSDGNLWMFGGESAWSCSGTVACVYNDLWKYSTTSGQWTWVGGTTTANALGSYEAVGMASSTSMPAARTGAATWLDTSGNLWLFGGEIVRKTSSAIIENQLNDLWKYSPTTGQWTWMGGSNTYGSSGMYGTQGIASSTSVPAARFWSAFWTDPNGKFWLFGGEAWSDGNTNPYDFNDLWEYDPSTNQWTWTKGSSSSDSTGDYGTLGTGSTASTPGARDSAAFWVDKSGNLWLFGGGYQQSNSGTAYLTAYMHNDLWKFDRTSGEWAWMGGSQTTGAAGSYSGSGIFNSSNIPSARAGGAFWTDANDNFWILGGLTCPASETSCTSNSGDIEIQYDLWEYKQQ